MNVNDRLTITLEVQQWQVIFNVLGEGPFRIVAPLVQEMQKQLQTQETEMLHKGNGADRVSGGMSDVSR